MAQFDPDAYLSAAPAPPAPPAFNPDQYIQATPAPLDQYQQAAVAERDRLKAAGVPLEEGFTRRVMAGPLLGWGDELGAAMTTPMEMIRHGTWDPREGYAYGKAREELASKEAAKNTGTLGDAAEIVGGLATLPGNVFARQASSAMGGGRLARVAGYGAEGATLGAIQGAGSAETMADVPGDALRSAAISGTIAAPFGLAANVARRSTAITPTEDELFNLGTRDYRARDRSPTSYDLEAVRDRMQSVADATRRKYGRDAPETINTVRDRIAEADSDIAHAANVNAAAWSGPPVVATAAPRDIASLRREIYKGGAKGEAPDERAGTVASKLVDRIMSRPDQRMLAPGVDIRDAIATAALDRRGRGNFSAGYRSQAVTDEVQKALDTAAGQHSGLNFENILRQNLNRARKNDAFGNFNTAEDAGVEGLIRGTARANGIREVGNMLGGGGGLGRMVAMGGGAGGGALTAYMTGNDPMAGAALGVGAGMTGRVLRNYGNNSARRQTEAFAEILRQRSPEYASRVAAAPTEIGPGLASPASGLKQLLTTGNQGGVRDAVAQALLYQTTGKRELPRVYIYGDSEERP